MVKPGKEASVDFFHLLLRFVHIAQPEICFLVTPMRLGPCDGMISDSEVFFLGNLCNYLVAVAPVTTFGKKIQLTSVFQTQRKSHMAYNSSSTSQLYLLYEPTSPQAHE